MSEADRFSGQKSLGNAECIRERKGAVSGAHPLEWNA
jgi:hypothetical protein